jgi:general secretion pathway protein J
MQPGYRLNRYCIIRTPDRSNPVSIESSNTVLNTSLTKISEQGFTLLELLVSISIFSVLGLGAYQLLQTVIDSHERVRSGVDVYTEMNLALSMMQRDFSQFVYRPVRDEYGELLPPILFEGQDYAVEFTRGGWRNPAGRPRSRLQRVAYLIDYEEETLTRVFWDVLDRAEDSEPYSQVLMHGISDFQITGYAGEAAEDDYSLDDVGAAAPLAVEIVITTETLGDTQRLFQLSEPYLPSSQSRGADAGQASQNPDAAQSDSNQSEGDN